MAQIEEGERIGSVLVQGGVIAMQYNPSPWIPFCDSSGFIATPAVRRFLNKHLDKGRDNESRHSDASLPPLTPAAEQSHAHGKYENTTFDEFKEAGRLYARHPVELPELPLTGHGREVVAGRV